MTWSYYVCRNVAGKWSVVASKYATMPPYEMTDGPYTHEVAIRIATERNEHRLRKLHRDDQDRFRAELL